MYFGLHLSVSFETLFTALIHTYVLCFSAGGEHGRLDIQHIHVDFQNGTADSYFSVHWKNAFVKTINDSLLHLTYL